MELCQFHGLFPIHNILSRALFTFNFGYYGNLLCIEKVWEQEIKQLHYVVPLRTGYVAPLGTGYVAPLRTGYSM